MKKLVAMAAIMGMAAGAGADLIANWELDGIDGNEATQNAGDLGDNVESAVLGRGDGLWVNTYADAFGARMGNTWEGGTGEWSTDQAGAVSNDEYFSISLTADDGYHFNFDEVFLRLSAQDASDVDEGMFFALRSDLTGTTNLGDYYIGGDGETGSGQNNTFTTDLSGVSELQGATSVEFQLFVWAEDAGRSVWAQLGFGNPSTTDGENDLRFEGTVEEAEPEPDPSDGGTVIMIH